ncbi:MAG: cupin domain-containing protein [Pseudomonadota bacterium]
MSEQDSIQIGKINIRYLIDGASTGTMGIFEMTIQPGANVPPPHSHSLNEEIVYVMEGKLQYRVGSETRDLLPGDSMHTPKGIVHEFSNPFSEPVRALTVLSPDIGAQYFREVAEVMKKGPPPDKSALLAVMKQYGLVPSAPPPA